MAGSALTLVVTDVVLRLADQAPDDEDVKAGWTALLIFLLLIAAVVFLGFSLVKQLRKAQAAEDAGVYGSDDEPPEPSEPSEPSESADPAEPTDSEPENHSTS
jgi:hypothetical protein